MRIVDIKVVKLVISCLFIVSLTGCSGHLVGMLDPKGAVAHEERRLFFDTLALMLIVVLPVIVMSLSFVYHYQAKHRIKEYKPNWSHSFFLECIWWAIPLIIIVVLGVLTWKKTYRLDPYARVPGYEGEPLLIQAIALPWKWLFIYPTHNIATINYLVLPVGQQVEFWMTTDNVAMSAFFIPQLGSQIYAMAGMRTRLHLVPNYVGEFDGMNTLYNGEGFSGMHFTVKVVEPEVMQTWVNQMKQSPTQLSDATYETLLKPSLDNQPAFYTVTANNLFNNVIELYMHAMGTVHPRQAFQHETIKE